MHILFIQSKLGAQNLFYVKSSPFTIMYPPKATIHMRLPSRLSSLIIRNNIFLGGPSRSMQGLSPLRNLCGEQPNEAMIWIRPNIGTLSFVAWNLPMETFDDDSDQLSMYAGSKRYKALRSHFISTGSSLVSCSLVAEVVYK